MRIQRVHLPSLGFGLLLLAAGSQGAPNATKSSFFPSSPLVDVTKGNSDPYMAEGSEFFPSDGMKHVKFPGSQSSSESQQQPRQQSSNSEAAFHQQFQQHQPQPQFQQNQNQFQQNQNQFQQSQQQNSPSVIIPVERGNANEEDANEAIDVILQSARSGKSLNLQQGGEELVKVASDPVIKEQLASGNEAEARGYIRNKLCTLGLMPCNQFGPVDKQGLIAPGYGIGHGHGIGHGIGHGHHGGWGPGIPAKDVALVQPVALKPVGHPIAAVPLDHHKPLHHGPPHHPHHPHHRGYGNGKVYGHHPPGLPPKPIYRPGYGQPPPPPGHTGIPHPGKPVIEHVHHHIHHQPTVHHHEHPPPNLYGSDEFGLSAKNPLSIATPGGDPVKIATFVPPAQKSHSLAEIETNSFNTGSSRYHSASSSSFGPSSNSPGFGGDFNRIEDCTCVRITQCASYDIVQGQGTTGREIISGFGKPSFGQVGYGIDPRNKLNGGVESNSTDSSSGEEEDSQESTEPNQQLEGRSMISSVEADASEDDTPTTTLSPDSGEKKPRTKRDTEGEPQTRVDSAVIDEQTAASGDGESVPLDNYKLMQTPADGEGRVFGQILQGMNDNNFVRNLTRFAGYDFGDDPTQLVKIDGTNLRILGKLLAFEPTWGVSFGLPGGYPQAGGGYPLNPVGNNPLVNPYNGGGIPLGPISVNPLVSFQKSLDKTKTKIWKPLVNLHITPNPYLFKGIKAIVKATKGKGLFGHGHGWGAPEYLYGGGYGHGHGHGHHHGHGPFGHLGGGAIIPSTVPVPYPVPVPVAGGFGGGRPVVHNHDHFHHYPTAHSSPFRPRPSYGYTPSAASPYYAGSSGYGYSSSPVTYTSGGGGSSGYSSGKGYGGSSYGSSVEYSPAYYKVDKKGPLEGLKDFISSAAGFSSSSDEIKIPTGPGGFGSSGGGGFRQSFDTKPSKRPGKVSEVSGLTPEQESLLEALLKEEEEAKSSRFRSGLPQEQTNNHVRPVEYSENSNSNNHHTHNHNHNSGYGYSGVSSPSSGSKTKFPEDDRKTNSNGNGNVVFDSSASGSSNINNDGSRGIGSPINFPDSRLIPNAASFSATSSGSSSSSMLFPIDERHRSIFQDQSGSSSANTEGHGPSFHSFNNNNDEHSPSNPQQQHQQGSSSASVTFPSDSDTTSSTYSHSRMTREIRTQPPPPTATIDGRVLHFDEKQRQLNIGGSCPGGYVCCRNPRQNNFGGSGNGGRPSGSGTNNFQQVANSPFGGSSNSQFGGSSNSLNSFSQGSGQCGKRNARGITGRISNPGFTEGDTDYGEYPWQVAILKKDGYDNVYVCGGALIDSKHIITAAHCIKGHAPTELRVRLGEWDVNHETEFYPHVERDVAAIAIHPEFYAGNLFNDIAIVKIEGFVDFRQNPHISPVCLPAKGFEYGGQRCFVTGWGKDAFGEVGKYQNVLKEVDLPVINNFDCEQKLKRTRLGPDFVLHPGFLCAGGEPGRDACKGDGGGPLVCEVGSTWQIAGIVSWGVGCGQQDVPGVYVKVSQYNDWIRKTVGGY